MPAKIPMVVGPRNIKDPNGVEFAWQTLHLMKTYYLNKCASLEHWKKIVEEANQYRIYERVPEDKPYGSLDAMMLEEFGLDEVAITEEIGKRQAAAQEKARENQEPLKDESGRPPGNPDKEEKHQDYGTSSDYRIRKLRRDCPDAAERLERGEFKSVSAAERYARGEEPNPPRRVPTALEVMKRAWNRASGREREAIASSGCCPRNVRIESGHKADRCRVSRVH